MPTIEIVTLVEKYQSADRQAGNFALRKPKKVEGDPLGTAQIAVISVPMPARDCR
jgi:hypothetical protein